MLLYLLVTLIHFSVIYYFDADPYKTWSGLLHQFPESSKWTLNSTFFFEMKHIKVLDRYKHSHDLIKFLLTGSISSYHTGKIWQIRIQNTDSICNFFLISIILFCLSLTFLKCHKLLNRTKFWLFRVCIHCPALYLGFAFTALLSI